MIFCDLHIHSRYSRATSKDLNLEKLERFARIKGLDVLGTGDFTHPLWLEELKKGLFEDGTGILKTKSGFRFVLQTEVSLVYYDKNKLRKVHLVVLAPDFKTVEEINRRLSRFGSLESDGRPTLSLDAVSFVSLLKDIDDKIEIIPAHIWTPWFGMLGSKSGFDSLEEAFKDKVNHIYALETGLSSDPLMNWRLSSLDRFTLVSNSDAHSAWPWRLGREANMIDFESGFTYDDLINAIRTGEHFIGTIEVDPSYGKYHFDGHRNCNISLSPEESKKHNNICPVCGKPLTIGVLNRVESLADRPEGFVPENAKVFKRLLPLMELISHFYKVSMASKGSWNIYSRMINKFGNEFKILLDVDIKDLEPELKGFAHLIKLNREQRLEVKPGFDGVYGELILKSEDANNENTETSNEESKPKLRKNLSLKDFFN